MSFYFGDPFRGWCFWVDGTCMQPQNELAGSWRPGFLSQRLRRSANFGGNSTTCFGSQMKLLVPTLKSYLAATNCFSVGFRGGLSPHVFPKGMSPTLASRNQHPDCWQVKLAPQKVAWYFMWSHAENMKLNIHRMFWISPELSVTKPSGVNFCCAIIMVEPSR